MNKIIIIGASLFALLIMVGGTAAFALGSSQNAASAPDVLLSQSAASEGTTTTTAAVVTTLPTPPTSIEPAIGSVPVPSTIPKNLPVVTVPGASQHSAPVSTPPTTIAATTTTLDPKAAIQTWWAKSAAKDWPAFQADYVNGACQGSCHIAKIAHFNALSSDLVSSKTVSFDFYRNANMPDNSMMLSCEANYGSFSANQKCSDATNQAYINYGEFVRYLQSWGIPVKTGIGGQ